MRPRSILLLALAAFTLFHILFVAFGPLDLVGDEAQYWTWSRRVDFGYYSKPPLVAWMIRASCAVVGENEVGVRLPAMLFAAATALIAFGLAKTVYGDEKVALRAALLLGTMPLFLAGSMLMTIDAPFVFFWTLATFFAAKKQWGRCGVAVGVGLLAKYTMAVWLVGLLFDREARKRVWIPALVALPFVVPILVWNAQHDWITFAHVSRHVAAGRFSLFDFLGAQLALVGPAIAPMVGALRRPESRTGGRRLLLATSLPYAAIVLVLSLFSKVEANWIAPVYVSLAIVAAEAVPRMRGWLRASVVYGIAALIVLHASALFYPLLGEGSPRRVDPTCRLRGWSVLGEAVSRVRTNEMVLSDDHFVAAQLAFYTRTQPETYCAASYVTPPLRTSQFDLWPDRALDRPELRGRDALYVGQMYEEIRIAFDAIEPLPPVVVRVEGREVQRFQLWRGRGFRGMKRVSAPVL